MLVKDVMTKDLAFSTPRHTVVEAARLMRTHDVGSIPIVEDVTSEKLVGIVTDRDICSKVVALGLNPRDVKVEAVMSTGLVTVEPDDELDRCAELMKERQVRRLPVVDEKGTLVGIVSQADIVLETEDAELVRETVARLSEKRRAG
jgi:CBS domain-containing protein